MRWYLDPGGDEAAGEDMARDNESDGGMAGIPAALLRRHGARVLNPAEAAAIPGQLPPRSTVYRAATLLVPAVLLSNLGELNTVLNSVRLRLEPVPEDVPENGIIVPPPDVFGWFPRTLVIKPADDGGPVVVDAWVALQALRAAANAGRLNGEIKEAVGQITLEHLLFGQAITGAPVTDGGGIAGGLTGPASTDSYLYSGGDARTPVDVLMAAPARVPLEDYTSSYGRRAVIAVLDTGVRSHPWLDVPAAGAADPFVTGDPVVQQDIYQHGLAVQNAGDRLRQLIRDWRDTPVSPAPLVGELDTHTGHGTFIAGIIRQVVPDAQVLAIRVMHSDGIVCEGDLLCALGQVASQVGQALSSGGGADLVDVISLSLGYFSEAPAGEPYGYWLLRAIDALRAMGVTITASAGNNATRRQCYPAAFAGLSAPSGETLAPLLSVGALNPDGSQAVFSDGGGWVDGWASGGAVLSTFPTDIDGSRRPEIQLAAPKANPAPADPRFAPGRAALDPDNYRCGFALWSGTSFSAPLFAALLAKELIAGAAGNPAGSGLTQGGVTAALNRAGQARAALEAQGYGVAP